MMNKNNFILKVTKGFQSEFLESSIESNPLYIFFHATKTPNIYTMEPLHKKQFKKKSVGFVHMKRKATRKSLTFELFVPVGKFLDKEFIEALEKRLAPDETPQPEVTASETSTHNTEPAPKKRGRPKKIQE